MVAVDHFLGGDAFLAGADGHGNTVLVATADEHHFLLLQAQVAHVYVGRDINTGEMADVYTAVGIGQSCRHQCAVEFLFHICRCRFIYCE